MPFTIPGATGAYLTQRAPGKTDFDILAAGYERTGVRTGCAVTAQTTPNMTTAVAGGTIEVASTVILVTGGNVTHVAADATNPRRDLVVVNGSAVKSVVAGTAAAVPVLPALPTASVALAAVDVPATVTTVIAGMITDKRVVLNSPAPIVQVLANQGAALAGFAPTFVSFGNGSAWVFADSVTQQVQLSSSAPSTSRGIRSVKVLCSPNGTVAGRAVVINVSTNWAAIGQVHNAQGDSLVTGNIVTVPATQYQMFQIDITSAFDASPIAANSWVGIAFQRVGANVSDTMTADLYMHAIILEWEQ